MQINVTIGRRGWRAPLESGARTEMEDMFPKQAILRGEAVPEDRRDCATALFCDMVGFTALSAVLQADQVSQLLHRLSSKLEALAEAHSVYKLKTIGDCYIAGPTHPNPPTESHVVVVQQQHSRQRRLSIVSGHLEDLDPATALLKKPFGLVCL